jgi:hypothetical protein
VVIDVLRAFAETLQGFAAVVRDHREDVHHIDAIQLFRVGVDLRVVHRGLVELIAPFPVAAPVQRTKDTALLIRRFDGGVDDV